MFLHGSCAALAGEGVLILAPPGGGKSDLVLRLIGQGWTLVADDQVMLEAEQGLLRASPPPSLAGRMEVFGLGLLERLPWQTAPLRLVAQLAPRAEVARLPEPARWSALGLELPALRLDGAAPSAPDLLRRALDVLAGRAAMTAGAFAA
ncbi:aldolase [Roseococcus sp. SDR]|uniref:HPr kinase/phosphorylase n=1 Tax=Roseococcus sp. SDR TaxID=2835532 RepID=UPI001BCDC5DA|nr:aldolase [Roseococcus sp. SDR]MBS7788859.1 aldolase [Roseococcus sp. SDR]MBV1844173.1 aldolase [Roseococcus sp. SDR]